MSALAAEWTKARTVPATTWLLAALAVALVAVGPLVLAATDPTAHACPADGCSRDLVRTALSGTWLAQAAAALTGVLAATAEYTHRTIVPTLTGTPARLRLGAAKVTVVTAAVTAAGAAGALVALGVAQAVTAVDPTPGPAARAVAGTALYLGALAALGAGAGLLLRDTAATATAVLGLLYAGPLLTRLVADPTWADRLARLSPTAGTAVQATTDLGDLPVAPWPALAVTAAYAAAAAAAGLAALRRRDV